MAIEDVYSLIKEYNDRTYDEEIQMLQRWGGERGLEAKLQTSLETGLDMQKESLLAARIRYFDKNSKYKPELPHFCSFVWDALKDAMLRILILAAFVQIVLGASPLAENPSKDWIEGVALCVAISVVTLSGSTVNYKKEKQFKELNDQSGNMVEFTVKRNGITSRILEENILVGDLVKIDYGNIIPADGIILSANDIKVDESALTGESDLMEKDSIEKCLYVSDKVSSIGGELNSHKKHHLVPSPVVISGSLLKQGQGWMLVLAVGQYSEKGKIQLQIIQNQEADDSKTPLEFKLEKIAEDIGWFGVGSAVLTLIVLFINFGLEFKEEDTKIVSNDDEEDSVTGRVMKIILLCIAIVVVAIPEGMPLAVTLSLAFAVKRMMNENCLVRKMHACETMGNANYICSDKTGTLTQNKMFINFLYDGAKSIDLRPLIDNTDKETKISELIRNSDYFEEFKVTTILNLEVEINEEGQVVNYSNTDFAFIDMFTKTGDNLLVIRNRFLPSDPSLMRKFPFNSSRKKMTTFLKHELFPTGYRVYMKGAAEIILDSCNYYLNPETSSVEELTIEVRTKISKQIKDYGQMALRNICVSYKDIDAIKYDSWNLTDNDGDYLQEKEGFVFVAIAAIRDILRPGVEEAVSICKKAGINVVMITGDNYDTACAIASDCNIVEKAESYEGIAITGKDFYEAIGGITCTTCSSKVESCNCPRTEKEAETRGLKAKDIRLEKITNMEAFKSIMTNLKVIARSRPDDKYALIVGLKSMDNIVSVTGDGTNDAKALSKSDVGFSMGIMGTDIAKDAADIIIMNDNFASIVSAIKWGRNIFDNIRKFIVFQLTVNICSVILVFITASVGNETPIEAIQMLWLNLIMDSLGSVSLATEPPHDRVFERKPYPKNESIISTIMWKHILFQSFVLFAVCFLLYLYAFKFIPEDEHYRVEEIKLIYSCYGIFPGHDGTNPNEQEDLLLLAGNELEWSNSIGKVAGGICGHYDKSSNSLSALRHYKNKWGNTAHMTVVFNVFCLWSLLNQVNSRVIDDSYNIFYRIEKNKIFMIILTIEIAFQSLLVQFGASAFKVAEKGLTSKQWFICIGIALLTYPISLLIKLLPLNPVVELLFKLGKLVARFFSLFTCSCFKNDSIENENLRSSERKLMNPDSKAKTLMSVVRKNKHLTIKMQSKHV